MEERHEKTATLYYTEDFLPLYAFVENKDWVSLGSPPILPPIFLDTDPDTKKLKEKEFTYFMPNDVSELLEAIAAAARAKAEELKLAAEEEEVEEEDEEDDVVEDPVDVAAVADPAAKRTSSSGYNIYPYLTGSPQADVTAARIDQAVGRKGYKLADDRKSLVRERDGRTIEITENGGMKAPPVTTGSKEKVASMLANDLIVMLRMYAVLYKEGKDAALPEGIINLRLNQKGLSTAQERAHILLTKDVEERFYAEIEQSNKKVDPSKPKPYPDAFLKKFKLNGDEIRLDPKRKPDAAPDATPDAKKPATAPAPAPAATSDYLSGVITNLEKGVADPNDEKAKNLLISILKGERTAAEPKGNSLLFAEGNVVKPKENKTDPKDQAALTKAVGLLQDMLSKYGYAITINKKADDSIESVLLPESGAAMAQAIESGARKAATPVVPPLVPPVTPGRGGRI